MYDILLLVKSTLLTADMILCVQKTCTQFMLISPLFHWKTCILWLIWCHCPLPSDLTKSDICVVPLNLSLGWLPYTLYIPCSKSRVLALLLRSLSKESIQDRGWFESFVKCFFFFFVVRDCYPLARHLTGGPPLAACPRMLIQYISSYPPWLEAITPSAAKRSAMLWW
jgi:hypothetical protein